MASEDLTMLGMREGSSRPEFRFRTRLEGSFWGFRFCYCYRDDSWYLDLENANGEATVRGVRMSTGVDLLAAVSGDRPPGQLFVSDDSGEGADPGRLSFRDSHRLVYRPSSVVAELEGTEDEIR